MTAKHEPTEVTRKKVEELASYGIPQDGIARVIGIDPTTLRIHYRDELDLGTTKANAEVAGALYRKALGDGTGAVSAAIFWLKTRARWKEESDQSSSLTIKVIGGLQEDDSGSD